jgi:methylase of polypeptide subunit release factors
MSESMSKELGAIYTPEGHARILTSWAIQSKTDMVLDMGIGPGIFVFEAYKRLRELGISRDDANNQIYGTEIDKTVFDKFMIEARRRGFEFHNIVNEDFFDISFPKFDAIVGNPPYVRRRGMVKENLSHIRTQTIRKNPSISDNNISNLSDLYIYFLLYALPHLKPGGRLATIIADTWLNTRYGVALKEYLLNEFEINQIISFDRRVFENAQVKAVILLALKKEAKKYYYINFARVRNGLNINELSSFVMGRKVTSPNDIVIRKIYTDELSPESSWGSILKSTDLFDEISHRDNIRPISEIASIQIGLETLAKSFFVIPKQKTLDNYVENEYIKPFAPSIYDFSNLVINYSDEPQFYLFYCSEQKNKLFNTKALDYILQGETSIVSVRGTSKTVIGYQSKERIIKARRPNWYDVKTECERRPISEILLPRFIYKEYKVLWNNAHYIPGGAIVQFFPKKEMFTHLVDNKVFLAILASSFTEIAFRIYAQVYGGGSSNLSIPAINKAPILNVAILSVEQELNLINAYNHLLNTNNRSQLDEVVYTLLKLSERQIIELGELLSELRNIAEVAKKAAHPVVKPFELEFVQ